MKTKWSFRVWGFIAAIYLASGVLWIPVLVSGQGMSSPLNMLLIALITFIPSLMGILFTYLVKNPQERREFWRRSFRWPKARLPILLAGLLVLPVVNISAFLLTYLSLGQQVPLDYAREMLASAALLLQFLLVEILFGPLSEELGWRGYLIGEMQSRWSALTSALVLGIFWGVWHTPAFLVPGMAQHEMGGLFSLGYFSFTLTPVLVSVLQTWVYNNTGGSTLVAGILMHFLANASLIFMSGIFGRFSVPDAYWVIILLLYALVTAGVVAIWGPKSLARKLAGRTPSEELHPLQGI